MLSVDVRITGKLYKVPVPASEIHIRTIKWLADEAANRYSRLYLSRTQATNTEVFELLMLLSFTNTLDVLPLCKVINRQINLTCLILSGNFMRDSCFQVLCTSLSLLENLTELNVSLNQLTFNSVRYLMDVLNHSSEQILPNLIKLNLSHNPLGNKCLNYLATVTRYLKLKTLVLADVDFTNEIFSNSHTDTNLVLDFVTDFDISFNQLSNKEIVTFLSWLQPKNIEALNISNNMHVSEGLIKDLINWLQVMPVPQLNLRSLYLSRTQATNTEVFELLMLLSFTNTLDVLDLSYNPNLTAVSLRRLMQSSQSLEFLNLIGCNQIFQYFIECTDSTWSQIQFKQIQLSCNFNEYFTEKSRFVDIWRRVCKNKAGVKEVPHFIKLSIID
ncbi:hypothetical protein FQA39_LY01713 [Lamprigera yunnana]|nr:hypothetical protein FQA39_LY01713 [Lamprigera yunnana]